LFEKWNLLYKTFDTLIQVETDLPTFKLDLNK